MNRSVRGVLVASAALSICAADVKDIVNAGDLQANPATTRTQ